MGWGQCDEEGGRLPEILLCFTLQGDRGVPGPEGEKVGALGQLAWWSDAYSALEQPPWQGMAGCPHTFLFLLSCRVRWEPQGTPGQQAER